MHISHFLGSSRVLLIIFVMISLIERDKAKHADESTKDILIYMYPTSHNITLYNNCSLLKAENHSYISCKCNDICNYVFKAGDIFKYVSFSKPRFSVHGVDKYGFLINSGVNNFKIRSQLCTSETCHEPTVTYLVFDEIEVIVITIVKETY